MTKARESNYDLLRVRLSLPMRETRIISTSIKSRSSQESVL